MSDIFVDEGEAASLFGSPSPSPSIGFVSELPALPGSPVASSASLAKNVGTIALPGSHSNAELAVSLPASPPSDRLHGSRQTTSERPQPSSKRSKRRKSKKSPNTPTPGPSITLPGASVPIPPNFLRNQQALLGLAGVVGNVHPVRLAKGVSRGTSPSNPIILEDGSGCAMSPSQAATNTTTRNGPGLADALTAQHDIFPVLRSLLPFLNAAADARRKNSPGWRRGSMLASRQDNSGSLNPPPPKKRRLKLVPAGAKDWDVPYPFADNEGPSQYLEAWEKKKAHTLMTQLNTLVRQAVEKATAEATATLPSSMETACPATPDCSGSGSNSAGIAPSPSTSFSDGRACSSCSTPSLFDYDPFAGLQDADLDNLLGAVNNVLDIPDLDVSGIDLLDNPAPSTSFPLSSDMNVTDSGVLSQDQQVSIGWDGIPIDPKILDFQWAPTAASNQPSIARPMDSLNPSFLSSAMLGCESAPVTAPTQYQDNKAGETQLSGMEMDILGYEQNGEGSRTGIEAPLRSGSPHTLETGTGDSTIRSVSPAESSNSAKEQSRATLLKRAKIHREQLANELMRTKLELWETTIEQGVLTRIIKDDSDGLTNVS